MKKLAFLVLAWIILCGWLADIHRHPGCIPPPPPPRWEAQAMPIAYTIGPIKLTGKLCRMIGGETTGWYVELDRCLCISNPVDISQLSSFGVVGSDHHTVTLDRIEIDYGWPEKLKELEGKEVNISGFLKWKMGVARGVYWYIIVGELKVL